MWRGQQKMLLFPVLRRKVATVISMSSPPLSLSISFGAGCVPAFSVPTRARGRRAVEVVARASDDREVAARIVETEAARMFDDETADAKPLRARRAR